jgi:hypothetical protein
MRFKKYLFLLLFGYFGILNAVEMPINKSVTINAEIGQFMILEFPFEIKGINSASFIPKYKVKKDGDESLLDMVKSNDTEMLPPLVEQNQKVKKGETPKKINKNQRSIDIKRGKNTLTLFPKKFGKLNMVVWGYNHPIVVNIIIEEGEFPKHISFTDFSNDKKQVQEFESVSHEKVIAKLMKNLFNHKVPAGYELRNGNKSFNIGDVYFNQTEQLLGLLYTGDSYVIENKSNEDIKLYEEMIYSDGIYAVAFENDLLYPKEKTRLFIVRRSDH